MEERSTVQESSIMQAVNEDDVQIKASKDELMRRIDVFMQYKKKQVDISNQREFTRNSTTNQYDDEGEDISTCARVDSCNITKGHIIVRKIYNKGGPSCNLPKPEQELWAELVLLGNKEAKSQGSGSSANGFS